MADDNELWIHQESAVISAESHDIWRFTPDFLVSSEIVPEEWICNRSTQSSEEVTISFGPSHWAMTPNNLWIRTYPNRSLMEHGTDVVGPVVPILANNFLVALPYLPSRRLWLFWQISAVIPDRNQWQLDTFFSKAWPTELGTVAVQPRLTVNLSDLAISVTIRNESLPRPREAQGDSLTFQCYASRPIDQTPDDMVSDLNHRTERLEIVERVIRQLLENGS